MGLRAWSRNPKLRAPCRRKRIRRGPQRSLSPSRMNAVEGTTLPSSSCASERNQEDGFLGCSVEREKSRLEMGPQEDREMAKLSLMFEEKTVKEVPVGNR